MGQHQSKAPCHAPFPDVPRPYPIAASGWLKASRRRKAGPSTDTISLPHHHFIPHQQRQRSAGPIRTRPEPSEYALRPSLPPSFITASPSHDLDYSPSKREEELATTKMHPTDSGTETDDSKTVRRISAHRISASPRQPPLPEESEVRKDHLVSDTAASLLPNTELLSAPAPSPDSDPTLSYAHRIGLIDHPDTTSLTVPAGVAYFSDSTARHASNGSGEQANNVVASTHSNMLRASHGGYEPSSHSMRSTSERGRNRRDHHLKARGSPMNAISSSSGRPRALIDKLLGVKGSAPEASPAETSSITVQAQPTEAASNTASVRTRLRSASQKPSPDRTIKRASAPLSFRQPSFSQLQSMKQPVESSMVSQHSPKSSPPSERQNRGLSQAGSEASLVVVGERRSSLSQAPDHARQLDGVFSPNDTCSTRPSSTRAVNYQRSVRSTKSLTSSNASLRARYSAARLSGSGLSQTRADLSTRYLSSPWWRSVSLKRKGSQGLGAGHQATKHGRSAASVAQYHASESAWVDALPEPIRHKLENENSAISQDSTEVSTAFTEASKAKQQGGLWNWPQRPSTARMLRFGLSRTQSGRQPRVEIEHVPPNNVARVESRVFPCSQVNVVGMANDTALTPLRRDVSGPSTENSRQSSFSSLAPPIHPSPLPPLRRPRRAHQQAQATFRQDRSGSEDSSLTLNPTDVNNASSSRYLHPTPALIESHPSHSSAAGSAIPETVASTATSSTAAQASTAATSVITVSAVMVPSSSTAVTKSPLRSPAAKRHAGPFTLSPEPTTYRRLSEDSDAGTREILLSDRESVAAPTAGSDTSARASVDELNPNIQSFYPAGAFLTGSIKPSVAAGAAAASPLSGMTEQETAPLPLRRVGALPDMPAPLSSSGHVLSFDTVENVHGQHDSEPSRSFRSARSYRSTSDGSILPSRPLPAVPGRSRGFSLEPVISHRDASFATQSFANDILQRPKAQEIDGLPPRGTQPPFMLMGMVAAATSPTQPTQPTHSSPDQNSVGRGHAHCARRPSRSSTGSRTSPLMGPRPLPSIQSRSTNAPAEQTQALLNRSSPLPQSLAVKSDAQEGQPLSSSAFHESTHNKNARSTHSLMGRGCSWNSAEEQWSTTVMAPSSTLSAVRGTNCPEKRSSEEQVHQDIPATPVETIGYPRLNAESGTVNDDQDAELARLEKSRSRSRTLPRNHSSDNIELPDSTERAPYADTGVQASLAALRARESPGESLRTILARQRILGEPEGAMIEFLRESHILDSETCLDDQEVRAASGPRRRRRAAPYPSRSDSRYSSDELSSSGRSLSHLRVEAARRRRQRNDTSMAEPPGSWLPELSGRGSESSNTVLAAIRLARSIIENAAINADAALSPSLREFRGSRLNVDANVSNQTQKANASLPPDVSPDLSRGGHDVHPKRPSHQRYVTALSHTDLTAPSEERHAQDSDRVAVLGTSETPKTDKYKSMSFHDNTASPVSIENPVVRSNDQCFAAGLLSPPIPTVTRTVLPSLKAHSTDRSGSMQLEPARFAARNSSLDISHTLTAITPSCEQDDRMTRRMLAHQQHQRSRSDVQSSGARSSRFTSYQPEKSRYDAQIEELLLLREKVLQLESSMTQTSRPSFNAGFKGPSGPMSTRAGRSFITEGSARPGTSFVSSNRISRPSKLGYTMPDIMAWQAGLGSTANDTSPNP